MFVTAIDRHPFITEDADAMFPIYAGSVMGDKSFAATLRALVYPRMSKEATLTLRYFVASFSPDYLSASAWQSGGAMEYLTNWLDLDTIEDSLSIVNLSSITADAEKKEEIFGNIAKNFSMDGYSRLEVVTVFYRKAFPVYLYINPEKRSAVMFTSLIGLRAIHYIQCSFPACLPWYFNSAPLTAEEMDLVNALKEKTPDRYIHALDTLARKYNFAEMRLRRLLDGFETAHLRSELQRAIDAISDCERQIDSYKSRIMDQLAMRDEAQTKMVGLKARIRDGETQPSPMLQYFLRNNAVELEECNANTMVFSVFTYCLYYNKGEAKNMIENDNAAIYYDTGSMSKDEMRELLTVIFIDRTLKLRFYAKYEFSMRGRVRGIEGTTPSRNGYIANPHISGYGCLGRNEGEVIDHLKAQRFVQAIEQCVASASGLSFTDYVVMEAFAKKLGSTNRTCIELPDGRVVSPKKALDYLHEGKE